MTGAFQARSFQRNAFQMGLAAAFIAAAGGWWGGGQTRAQKARDEKYRKRLKEERERLRLEREKRLDEQVSKASAQFSAKVAEQEEAKRAELLASLRNSPFFRPFQQPVDLSFPDLRSALSIAQSSLDRLKGKQ